MPRTKLSKLERVANLKKGAVVIGRFTMDEPAIIRNIPY